MKKVIDRGKRSKKLSEVKPIENISKNLQSFLEISPEQKEVLPSHKLQDHAYSSLKNCQNPMSHPSLSHIEQECQESLIHGKIGNHKIQTKVSNICKAKLSRVV